MAHFKVINCHKVYFLPSRRNIIMVRVIPISCVAVSFGGFCSSSLMFPWRLMDAPLLTSVQSEQSQAGISRDLAGNQTFQLSKYRGADKFLPRPGRKQARKHVRDARDFNNIEKRAVIKFLFFFLQDRAPKEIHVILTEILDFFFLVGLRTYRHPCRDENVLDIACN